MIKQLQSHKRSGIKWVFGLAALMIAASQATAAPVTVLWTDWLTGSPSAGTASGQIVTPTTTVNVSYVNSHGYSFFQNGVAGDTTDYFDNANGVVGSPYTSSVVANIPTKAEMIALNQAGSQTLSFSQTIANPFFSYVSLNGNGYGFLNQDFDILSFGSSTDPEGPNYSGHCGSGTSFKKVVDLGGGNFEYQLLGTGEPHGTIRFKGAFDTLTWTSLSSENWNGFTVGIEGTAQEVFNTPDAGSTLAFMSGAFGLLAVARRRTRQ